MGYTTKDIAVITEPKIVSLSATPNFVTFASKPTAKILLEYNIQVNINVDDAGIASRTLIRLIEPSGTIHAFHGTTNPLEVSGSTFYVAADRSDTAENLREAMLANRWINANFEIRIPFNWTGGAASNGRILNIKSKDAGLSYNITINAPNNLNSIAYTITAVNPASYSGDSIRGEIDTAEIELDIYTGAAIKLGEDDRVTTADKLGELALTMQKSYAGAPLWFELNAIFSQYQKFNTPPPMFGWFDTGTAQVFRFIARKKAVNSFAFYQSNALYVLSGYGYASDDTSLEPYIYDGGDAIKLLSNKPQTPYIIGQLEYLNFLFKKPSGASFDISIEYAAYSPTAALLGKIVAHTINSANLSTVNTCALNIDQLLASYPDAGIVRVRILKGATAVSDYLEYIVRPQALHSLCQFTFLNKLGGWDTFNFDTSVRTEVKTQVETFNKTLTPDFRKGDSLETVYTSAIEEPRIVEGAPVSDKVAEWLKELAASRVVLDGEGNYIIKEEFTLPFSAGSANMQTPTLKYRLSETYTND